MARLAFNITEHRGTGLHTVQVLVEDGDPQPLILVLNKCFQSEMAQGKIRYEGKVCTIHFVTDNGARAMQLRQCITDVFFEEITKVN